MAFDEGVYLSYGAVLNLKLRASQRTTARVNEVQGSDSIKHDSAKKLHNVYNLLSVSFCIACPSVLNVQPTALRKVAFFCKVTCLFIEAWLWLTCEGPTVDSAELRSPTPPSMTQPSCEPVERMECEG